MTTSPFINDFINRGYFHQCTDESGLDKHITNDTPCAYIGFDCTASTLHVGSLVQIMILRLLQSHGIRPIVLLGGGTTKVGDPSGKDETRKLLDEHAIASNMSGIRSVLEKFIDFSDSNVGAIMVNNDQWLSSLNYVEFLRDIGRHFSINRMLGFESVKMRLEREQNLSFLEFNYMILQAYDFVELAKEHDCRIQIGGSDQWGNIVNGIELNRRLGGKELFGLTTPLITTSSGGKMGKTANGAIWLTEQDLSPYDYWQFWRNTDDKDVIRFLKLFTDLSLEEINELEKLEGAEINEAKIVLANEATKICHGVDAAQKAELTSKKVFEQSEISNNLPTYDISRSEINENVPAFKLFIKAELVSSGGEAKRLIKGGGGRLNDIKIDTFDQKIDTSYFDQDGVSKISAGKKKHALLKLVD